MPLDPQIAPLLEALAGQPTLSELDDVAAARQTLSRLTGLGSGPEVGAVEERRVPTSSGEIGVRIYRPPAGGPAPLLVWFHGGGFALGDLDGADATARALCVGSGAVVASVDYPLAPEHPYPAAPESCWEATRALAGAAADLGADPALVAVGGDSAGGNLAAVTALLARDRGGPALAFQLLVYPVVDLLASYPSVRQNGEGYLLTADDMAWFTRLYLGGRDAAKEPTASPIYAEDLAGLPPAMVLTAEFDPLRDEGEAYAERLRLAGVGVEARRYDGMIHGFFSMTDVVDRAREAMADVVASLRTALVP